MSHRLVEPAINRSAAAAVAALWHRGMVVRQVPSWPLYGVTSDGEVWRLVRSGDGKFPPYKAGALSMDAGYRKILLRKQKDIYGNATVAIHRMVAEAWLGPRPPGLVANHIDGVKTNNRVSNLEYVTASENVRHAYRLGLNKPRYKIDPSRHGEVRSAFERGVSRSALALRYGVGRTTINDIVAGRR